MSDLIDRQTAMKMAKTYGAEEYDRGYENGKKAAQPGWIPCSTALPKDEEEVIVSIHDDSGDYSCDYTSSGWYAAAGEFWVVDNEASMRVVAWMPLPKPWEGGQDESDD